eukprot:12216188-Alexandrium_andersonii.AAC.2
MWRWVLLQGAPAQQTPSCTERSAATWPAPGQGRCRPPGFAPPPRSLGPRRSTAGASLLCPYRNPGKP